MKRLCPCASMVLSLILTLGIAPAAPRQDGASERNGPAANASAPWVPDVAELLNLESSELRDFVSRYSSDRAALLRRHDVRYSRDRRESARRFYQEWRSAFDRIDFEKLGIDGRIDYLLLENRIDYELRRLEREEKQLAGTSPLIPFLDDITGLQVARRRLEHPDPEKTAGLLARIDKLVERTQKGVEAALEAKKKPAEEAAGRQAQNKEKIAPIQAGRTVAYRASRIIEDLQKTLEQWFKFYNGYDPLFSWWVSTPYEKLSTRLKDYRTLLREKIVGFKKGEDDPIVGDPIGRDAIMTDLAYEMIPYTPEQLIAIAEREFSWCESEMRRASRDLGYGDEWKKALEHVKTLHVDPGEQPDLIRNQAREAVDFVEQHNLITVPELAKDVWRMEMMSPERQKVSPFFLGGEVMQVSYPTDTMTQEEKLMSMRGNNIHFARATVFHELIPGHHLQGFMTARYNTHRRAFSTPFWTEGWALHWEMLLWDLDFPKTPEDRIGMLFWRMHRCARIIFSLRFHLGTMTPEECIDFLVDRVGHERNNATAEVRRSFEGSYPPLYQLAYMIGGLQFRALHKELIESGRMTDRQFHDTILKMNSMPVEMIRARLEGRNLTPDFKPEWKFAGEIGGN